MLGMKRGLLAVVLAAILFGAIFYFYRSRPPNEGQSPVAPLTDTSQTSSDTSAQNQGNASTAANYDECIAEGNQPLPDAADKCLTKDGHVFVKGVVE